VILGERGRGWILYCFVLYTSVIWLEVISRGVLGFCRLFG
jgi:hypothetical protein